MRRAEAGEAIRSDRQSGSRARVGIDHGCVWANLPGRDIACGNLVGFASILSAAGERQGGREAERNGIGQIEIEVELALLELARLEACGRTQAEGRVHGIGNAVIGRVAPVRRAHVIGEPGTDLSLQPADQGRVGDRRAEIGRKSAGIKLTEAETRSAARVRQWNTRRDETRIRVAIEEGSRAAAPTIVAERVELHGIGEIDARVHEKARRFRSRIAPTLGGHGHTRYACIDQRLRVRTLDAA